MSQKSINSEKVLLSVREEEKLRISQEIHDTLSQSLVVLKMLVQQYIKQGSMQEHGPQILDHINTVISQTHAIVNDLRPDFADNNDLMKAIKIFIETVGNYSTVNIHTSLDKGSYNYSKYDCLQLYRIVQESIVNAVKHSNASDITVEVVHQHQQDIFIVRDNGVGFNPEKIDGELKTNHFGLGILRERCEAIGAKLEINSSRGTGTTVTVRYMHKQQEDL